MILIGFYKVNWSKVMLKVYEKLKYSELSITDITDFSQTHEVLHSLEMGEM
uniref:Uncharacterized protein n=1 Tax=Octopus bimaculoides TaxID=37653 RepID=A0A0L8GS58_OCTBM